MNNPSEIRFCLDIGSSKPHVGIGLSDGVLLANFEMLHATDGINTFFNTIDTYQKQYQCPVSDPE